MINWKSILSSFNDKPTLLEWLKLVEKALKESVLTSVTTEQDADKANTKLIFNFEDGTQIATGFFPTKGKDAAEIIGATSLYVGTTNGLSKSRVTFDKSDNRSFYADIMAKAGKAVESFSSAVKEVTDENTVNTITVNYDDKTSNTFEVSSARGKQGATGADGVSVTSFETVSYTVVGDNTNTTVRAHYSNNTTDEFIVTAKNGSSGGGGKVYKHKIHFSGTNGEIYTNIYSSLNNSYNNVDSVIAILSNEPYQDVWYNGENGTGIGIIRGIVSDTFNIKLYSIGSGGTVSAKDVSLKITGLTDNVTEAK